MRGHLLKRAGEKKFDIVLMVCYPLIVNNEQHPPRLCWFRPDKRTTAGYLFLEAIL